MPSAEVQFQRAIAIMDTLPGSGPIMSRVDKEDSLELFKYRMQATKGNNNTPKPGGVFYFLFGSKEDTDEWQAWKNAEGTPRETAYEKYVEACIRVLRKPDRQEGKAYITEIQRD